MNMTKSNNQNKPYEIRWHGRGGQGAITAARIVAKCAFKKGYLGVTAAPSFGAERRGAPVSALTRLSAEPIRTVSQVETPDAVVVLDDSLLNYPEVMSGFSGDTWLIINTSQPAKELGIRPGIKVATVDATRVCRELGLIVNGQTVVNTAIVGALARAIDTIDLETIRIVIKENFSNSYQINISAMEKTYESTKLNGAK
jgi:pyruvate ferredoxin oxidoreductase gamma subunit